MDKRIYITIGATVIIALLLWWLLSRPSTKLGALSAAISKTEMTVGDTLYFSDSTENALTWAWYFGDGGMDTTKKGMYVYNTEGAYDVKLVVNESEEKVFKLKVNPKEITDAPPSPIEAATSTFMVNGKLMGPKIKIGEMITCNAQAGSDLSIDWEFGESGIIDSHSPQYTYTYKKPGKYTIILRSTKGDNTKTTKYPLIVEAVTSPAPAKAPAKAPAGGGGAKPVITPPPATPSFSSGTVQNKIQGILDANGNGDKQFSIKTELLKAIGDNASVPVSVTNTGESFSTIDGFYQYLKKACPPGTKVGSVNLTQGNGTVSKISVTINK